MLPYGFVRDGELALGPVGAPYFAVLVVQPGAHTIGAGEEVRVALGIDDGTAAAHGKAHDGPLSLAAAAAVFLFGRGEELLEKEVFVRPVHNIEVPVLVVVDVVVSGVGHDDNGRYHFSAGDELIGHIFHPADFYPIGVISVQAVQKINHRVLLGGVISAGKVYVVLLFAAQELALDAVRNNFALGRCRQGAARKHEGKKETFHIRAD